MVELPFRDRLEAGRMLGAELATRKLPENTIVLGLARGGVAVGYAVASTLGLPLEVLVVRKLGVPWHPELAMGALVGGKVRVFDEALVRELGVTKTEIAAVVAKETAEAERRSQLYGSGASDSLLHGRTIVLVDDGLATGSSMLAAVRYIESVHPAGIIVAVPVASVHACRQIRDVADECVCVATPEPFHAVGAWYEDFREVTDTEVQHLLKQSRRESARAIAQPELTA